MLKRGDIVRYSKPTAGEEDFRFVVLEAFEKRVTMKILNSGFRIEPIETVLQTDVRLCEAANSRKNARQRHPKG